MTEDDRQIYARLADHLSANTAALAKVHASIETLPQRISVVVPPARISRTDLVLVGGVAGLVCGLVFAACAQ